MSLCCSGCCGDVALTVPDVNDDAAEVAIDSLLPSAFCESARIRFRSVKRREFKLMTLPAGNVMAVWRLILLNVDGYGSNVRVCLRAWVRGSCGADGITPREYGMKQSSSDGRYPIAWRATAAQRITFVSVERDCDDTDQTGSNNEQLRLVKNRYASPDVRTSRRVLRVCAR